MRTKHTNLHRVMYNAEKVNKFANRRLDFGRAVSTNTTAKHSAVVKIIKLLQNTITVIKAKERQSASSQAANLVKPLLKIYGNNVSKVRHAVNNYVTALQQPRNPSVNQNSQENTANNPNSQQNNENPQNNAGSQSNVNPQFNNQQNDVDSQLNNYHPNN